MLFLFACCGFSLFAQDPCDFQIDVGEDINLDLGQSYQIEALVSVPVTAIAGVSWTPAAGLSCTDCFNPIAMPLEDICYIVSITDTTQCTLSDTLCIFVMPTAAGDLHRPGLLEVFPNPARERLTVQTDRHPISQMRIFDAAGRTVWSATGLNDRLQEISVAALPAGVYFLETRMGRYWAPRRFVKR